MTWIYLLESNPKKMKSKPPPPFLIFWPPHGQTVMTHYALSEKEEWGIVSNFLYI
jgi:hypothetical protein